MPLPGYGQGSAAALRLRIKTGNREKPRLFCNFIVKYFFLRPKIGGKQIPRFKKFAVTFAVLRES
jgi:hypothetical protein